MRLIKSAHTVYRTQYHIVWVTRYRRKILNKGIREYLETKLQEVRKYYPDWEYIEIGIVEDHLHLHMVIPPKYAVSQVIGYIKGKSAIHLARVYGERKRNFVGQHFWARGYFVSTVGRDEELIREYIRHQEEEDMHLEQINLWR